MPSENELRPRWMSSARVCPAIHVVDDFLANQELVAILDALHHELRPSVTRGAEVWSLRDEDQTAVVPPAMVPFVQHVTRWADPDRSAGSLECWSNEIAAGEQLRMHQDKDEMLYRLCGRVFTPLYSAVYYPNTEGVVGGELELQGMTISPRSNRVVIFSGHLRHRVRLVTDGTRRSIVINGWATAPLVVGVVGTGRPNDG